MDELRLHGIDMDSLSRAVRFILDFLTLIRCNSFQRKILDLLLDILLLVYSKTY